MAIDYPYNFSGYLQVQQWHCPCCANYNKCPTCGKAGYHPPAAPWTPTEPWVYNPGPTCSTTTVGWSSGDQVDQWKTT